MRLKRFSLSMDGHLMQFIERVKRFLNPKIVFNYGNKPSEVYESVKEGADNYAKWSNEVERGERPKKIEQSDRTLKQDLGRGREDGRRVESSFSRKSAGSSQETTGRGKDLKLSIAVDSEGHELSQGQQDYFKDSKIRDENGRLKVMYHGTSEYGFTVFDKKKAKSSGYYGKGFYFSDADSHAGQYGKQYKVFLNITNPFEAGDHNITKEQF